MRDAAEFGLVWRSAEALFPSQPQAATTLAGIAPGMQDAFNAMKVVGAGYLLWLAYQAIRKGSMLNTNVEKAQSAKAALLPTFLSGLTVNLSNPKVVLFFVTFLPGFVEASDPHVRGKLLFLGLYFVAINIPFSALFIFAAERLVATLKSNPKIMRAIDYVFAGVFGIFALTIIRAQART